MFLTLLVLRRALQTYIYLLYPTTATRGQNVAAVVDVCAAVGLFLFVAVKTDVTVE